MLLLPTKHEQEAVLNALRLGSGRSFWYASLAPLTAAGGQAASGASRGSGTRLSTLLTERTWTRALTGRNESLVLSARRASETKLEWTLREASGAARDAGLLGVERDRMIADLWLTERWLILLCVTSGDRGHRYRVGIAPRCRRARVQWSVCDAPGWPELLHAREDNGMLQLLLALRADPHVESAAIVRCEVDPRSASYAVRPELDFELNWPSVSADAGGTSALLCGTSAPRLHGGPTPVLVGLDLRSRVLVKRSFGFGRELGAPAVAFGRERSSGYVLLPIYDAVRDRTECWVLDAASLMAAPRAIISLGAVRALQRTYWIESRHLHRLDGALAALSQLSR